MSHLIENIASLQSSIPNNVTIVIATKYATIEDIGHISKHFPHLAFGENRIQQGDEKQRHYPTIENPWHFIGHLQRNKVKKVIQQYTLIHSVDSQRLIEKINTESEKCQQITPILLQVNPCEDEKKFGFNESELFACMDAIRELKNIAIKGLMSMAPHTNHSQEIKKTFKKTRSIYDKLVSDGLSLEHLSMGMSSDYKIAINEGSTMIRIGSIIFS